MLGLVILFGIPFLYVWKVKHPELNIWEAYARFFIIFYGTLFIAGFLAGYLIYYAFGGAREISTAIAKGTVAVLGLSMFLPAIYVARRRIQMAPLSSKE